MQHTQIANAKKEVIEVLYWLEPGCIISELYKIHENYKHNQLTGVNANKEEIEEANNIFSSVIYFIASLNKLYIESKTEIVSTSAEMEASEKQFEATPDSINNDAYLAIGRELFSKFSCEEITDALWDYYLEIFSLKGSHDFNRLEFSNIGFTLKMVTRIISEMNFLLRIPVNAAIAA